MRPLYNDAVCLVGEAGQEAVLQNGDQRGGAPHEEVDVPAPLLPVKHHVVRALEEGVTHIVLAHGLVVEATGHQLEGGAVPHFGVLDRTVETVAGIIQSKGFGVFQYEALELAGEQVGFKPHPVAGVKRPGFSVPHGDKIVINHKTEQAVRPAVGNIIGPGGKVGMLEILRLHHDFHAHVLFGDGEEIFILGVVTILVALRGDRTDQLFAQHLVAGEVRHADEKTFRMTEGIDALGAVPAEILLAHIQHPGTAQREGGLVDHRIFQRIKGRLVEIIALDGKLAGPVPVVRVEVILDQLGVEAVFHVQFADLFHMRELVGHGEFQRPVPGRGDERQLDVGLVIMVGGKVKPQTVSRLVHQNFFPFRDLHVAHRVPVAFQIHKIGMLAKHKERIAHEGRGVFLRLRNVEETARGNMGLAAFNLALAHDHTFRQMANLAVLVLECPGPQPAQIRNVGHVSGGLQSVRRLGSGSGHPGEAGRAHHRPDQQVFPSSLEKHRGFLEAKGWCSEL